MRRLGVVPALIAGLVGGFPCRLIALGPASAQRAPRALLLMSAQGPTDHNPSSSLHTLIAADAESSKPSPDGFPDLSREGLAKLEAQDRSALRALEAIPRGSLGVDDRTLYDLFERQLLRRLEEFRLRLFLVPTLSEESRLWRALGAAAPASDAEYEQLRRKVDAYAAYVEQFIGLLREGKERRMLPSRELATQDLSGFTLAPIWMLESPFNSQLAKPIPVRPEAINLVRERALPALQKLKDFLDKEYFPSCPEMSSLADWPNGGEVYSHLLRQRVTGALTPRQIHELGLREVARIRKAMAATLATAGREESVEDFLKVASTDKKFYFEREEDLLAAYRTAVARIEPLLPRVVRRIPSKPLDVQPSRRGGPSAAYQPTRGCIFVEVSKLQIRPKFEVLALMLHEGMPGHHLQMSLELEHEGGATLPAVRELRASGAFGEGWATYAETLGDDMGIYTDPYDKFGQLSMELMRAVRVVIDTGIHAYGWSSDKAKQYFIAETGKSPDMAELEVRRAAFPGRMLGYQIGAARFKAMRESAARALGSNFDVRNFHDALLQWGPLPLDMLERKLDECLKESACRSSLGPPGGPAR